MAHEIAAIVADRLSRPRSEIAELQAAIVAADIWPRAPAHQLALLVLAVLFGATRDTAVSIACEITNLRDKDDIGAHVYVATLIESLATMRADLYPEFAFHSSIACESGDGMAVRIRVADNEGHTELTFTGAGPYRPHDDLSVGLALQLPGRLLFRMCRDLAAMEAADA